MALVSKEDTKTVERAKARLARKSYSKISNLIAFEILERLDELGWKQVHLAEKMNVSKQQVSKWVKGSENFTLDTLVRLSEVLGVDLIVVAPKKEQVSIEQVQYITYEEGYTIPMPQKRLSPRITMNDSVAYEDDYVLAN